MAAGLAPDRGHGRRFRGGRLVGDLCLEAWIAGLAPLPFQAAPRGSTRHLVIDFKLAYHRL
jgi:hypothetical protein